MAVLSDYNSMAQKIYIAYMGRPADTEGLSNMTAQLLAANVPVTGATAADTTAFVNAYGTNATIKAIIDNFGTSPESVTLYGTGTTVAFVDAIFQQVLGRAPLLAGQTFWASALDTGAMTRGEAALRIVEGALNNTTAQGLTDATSIANKLAAALAFTTALDTPAEIAGYSGSAAAVSARNWLATVTDVPATLTAALAGVDTAVSAMVATGTGGGDSTAPTLSSSLPADGAATVAVGDNIVLTFSEAIVLGAGNIVLKAISDNSTIETFDVATGVGSAGGTVTVNGTAVTVNPFADLSLGTGYYVTVADTAVRDAAGNPYAGITSTTALNFTTAAAQVFTLTASAPIITEIMVGGAITKAMTFTLTLGSVPVGDVTVDYATLTSGTAASGTDFVADTGTVTFVAGQTVANVSVVVNDDALAEGDETVAVQFSGTSLAAPVTGTGTILKNDTAGLTVVLTAGTETPVLGSDDDTINSTQAVPVQLSAVDIVAGGDGTDVLTITPTIDTAFTLDDAIFTQVSGIDKIVIFDTGTGGQTITTAGLFQAAFGAAGVDLQTTATTAAEGGTGMVVNLSAVTGPVTLTTTTTTGAQTITTGTGNATVFATASTGAVGITTGAGADVVTLTTSADTDGPGCVINTGAGNDIITIVAAGAAAASIPNLITGGLGADTITLGNDAEWNDIAIGNADSGITLAGADSIIGFVAATDTLRMGTAASVTGASTTDNYVEATVAVADFAAALGAANIQLAALALATTGDLEAYAFQWDAANGYLFNDVDGNGTADQVVVLVGVVGTTISDVDIIA